MSEWASVLYYAGCSMECQKNDYVSAYKHCVVLEEDHCLQVEEFGGRMFVKTRLVFECKSSPFNYNEMDRMLIMIVLKDVGMDPFGF